MSVLVDRLPAEALTAQTPEQLTQEPWSTDTELLAQLLEVLSVVATEGHGLKKPMTVSRPAHLPTAPAAAATTGDQDGYAQAIGVLQATRPGARKALG